MINSLLKLPKVGKRFYFGFSTIINVREPKPTQKLLDAIKAVPQNRILLESDWNNVDAFETAMLEIHRLVAETRVRTIEASKERRNSIFTYSGLKHMQGWTLEETADITTRNAEAALAGLAD